MKSQLVRNFAGKIVVGLKKFDHISQCLKSLRWLCIEDKWLLSTTAVVHKCLPHHQVHDYLNDKLLYRLQIMIRQSAIISGFLVARGHAFREAKLLNLTSSQLKNCYFTKGF